jgi:hypothetical protein
MPYVTRRLLVSVLACGVSMAGVLATSGTASAAQCPPGYALNPMNTQQCTPTDMPTDPSGAIPPGSQPN